jgi:hypothetical protein
MLKQWFEIKHKNTDNFLDGLFHEQNGERIISVLVFDIKLYF